jgi:DNA-directed RNA polymerase subunit RPC12/RpoP
MQKDYSCDNRNCGKQFKVMNESPAATAAEGQMYVQCPHCQASKSITWPIGQNFIVAP